MRLEQLIEVAALFVMIGICLGWLIATTRQSIFRSIDRMLPPRYLKTTALRRRSDDTVREDGTHERA